MFPARQLMTARGKGATFFARTRTSKKSATPNRPKRHRYENLPGAATVFMLNLQNLTNSLRRPGSSFRRRNEGGGREGEDQKEKRRGRHKKREFGQESKNMEEKTEQKQGKAKQQQAKKSEGEQEAKEEITARGQQE